MAAIRVFDVRSDGTLANGREWARTTGEGAPGGPAMIYAADCRRIGP
jgi:hypothetical protein